MAVAVRLARDEDAETISALNEHVHALHAAALPWRFKPYSAETFPPAEVRALMARAETRMILATVADQPAGYVYAEIMRRPETAATHALAVTYVHHISVAPAYRGRGVGAALLQAARAEGEAEGVTELSLDVWSFNEAAQRFFLGQGLRPFNVRMWTI